MTPEEQVAVLERAREVYATDPELAFELRRQVANSSPSLAWSQARIDLAAHEAGNCEYERVLGYAQPVLDASIESVEAAARAVAGILVCDANEALGKDVDARLLEASIEAATRTAQHYYAGIGFKQRARALLKDPATRAQAIATYEHAVSSFDASQSMFAAPGLLLELAKLKSADGDVEAARADIERGLERLARHPFGGTSARVLREKLTALRERLAER